DECIIQKFNAANCPQLKNKPKLFFIQSCRGDRDDKGVPVPDINRNIEGMQFNSNMSDACSFPPQSSTQRMRTDPSHCDVLISNATVFGYRAYRNTDHGSWYIQALAFCLWHHAHDKHIEEILSCVQNKVRELRTEDEFVQCTTYYNQGFDKNFYFNPGYFE
ncbi:caspase Nc-like protein, partial [Dinothrombium tinctorium]